MTMEYCTRYGKRSEKRTTEVVGPTLTRQAFKGECDINNLMKKYIRSGELPAGVGNGTYGDFSSAGDFMAAQHVLLDARAQFESLPAKVRDRFKNSPAAFLMFVADKKNYDEARALGLLNAEPKPKDDGVATPPTPEVK